MKNPILLVACVLALCAGASVGFAQEAPPQTPPVQEQPAQPAPTPLATEAPVVAPEPTPAPAHTCRTRKAVGEACACRLSPDHVGVVEAATDGGRNMCVVRMPPPVQ